MDYWANIADVAKWEMETKAAEQSVKQRSLAKKLAKEGGFQELMKPIRDVYRRLSFAEQNIFLVMVVNEMRRK
jgi:hypothetical protein